MPNNTLRILSEFTYDPPTIHRGYAGRRSTSTSATGRIAAKPVTRGDEGHLHRRARLRPVAAVARRAATTPRGTRPKTRSSSPPARAAASPSTPAPANRSSSRISPLTDVVIDSNVGRLLRPATSSSPAGTPSRFRASRRTHEVIVVHRRRQRGTVHDRRGARGLPGRHPRPRPMAARPCSPRRQRNATSSPSVTAGRGAEHTRMGCLNFSLYDRKRQDLRSSRPGAAASAPSSATRASRRWSCAPRPSRGDSQPSRRLRRLIAQTGAAMNQEIARVRPGPEPDAPAGAPPYLVEIMDDYDLLPVHNFRFGGHPDTPKIDGDVWESALHPGSARTAAGTAARWPAPTPSTATELKTGPYKGQMRHRRRPGVRDGRRRRLQLRHLRADADPGDQLLLRHLRHRHHLLRHADWPS